MQVGVFYEHQLPKPWEGGQERRILDEALEQVVLADRLGIDYAWEVEHHFLEEYSHSSAPEVFLGAVSRLTRSIRLGHGIRHVIPAYNHPARVAEGLATLDLLSNGRVDFGFGEGATRHEIAGFNIDPKHKRALALEAAEQIANMMVMTPYPGYEGQGFSMPCRNVIPKPVQKPHPPMWIACTNRDTITLAARLGLGALTFAFVSPDEAKKWVDEYYSIIRSDQCVPLGHSVNANIAVVTPFSVHPDREEAKRRGSEGFAFFAFALAYFIVRDAKPGHTDLWTEFERSGKKAPMDVFERRSGIGNPDDLRHAFRSFEEVGVDQVILLQQSGRTSHDHICQSLELFADEVMGELKQGADERRAQKQEELAPFVEAALARKQRMPELSEADVPVIPAIIKR